MLFHILCLLIGTHASTVLEAYRLVQYDHQGVPSGSRTVRLAQVKLTGLVELWLLAFQYATLKREGATLFRNVVLLPFKEATIQIVKEILDPTAGVAGLVILMSGGDLQPSLLEDMDADLFLELEKFLILQAIAVPVYFVEESHEVNEIVSHLLG